MIMTKKEDGTYKQVGFIYRNDEIDVSGEVPVEFKTMDGVIEDYMIEGNTYQSDGVTPDTPQEVVGCGDRTGNTFDYVKYFESTFTYYNDYFEWAEIKLNPFTTYTFSTSYPEVMTGNIETAFIVTTSTETPTTVNGGISSTRIVTKTTEADGIVKIYKRIKGKFVVKKADFDSGDNWLMINEGSTPLPYEPYGYKVDVVSRGKNLFDGTIEQGSLADLNGSLVESLTRVRTTKISVSEGAIYTMSSNLMPRNIIAYKNSVFVAQVYDGSASAKTSVTFTVPAGANQIAVAFKGNQAGTVEITPNDLEWLMLNSGSTLEPYEPYTPPIATPIYLDSPLYKIGEYSDSRGKTEEVRIVKESILTGDEEWRLQSINSNGIANFYFYPNGTTPNFVSDRFVLCSHFEQQNTTIADTSSEGIFLANRYIVYIRIKQERASTVDGFKSYLKEQYNNGTPVKVYYVLATPETKTVDAVEIPTIQGTNIIDVNTEVKPSSISLSRPMTEIKKILSKEGKVLFEKGFTREVEGEPPLSLSGIGKDLKDYSIEGNAEQQTYSGKNLVNIIPFEATFGASNTVIRDFLNSLGAGTYTISYNTELLTRNDSTDSSTYGIRVINESESFELLPAWGSANIGTVKKISLKITITEDNKGKFTNVYFYGCGTFSVGVTGSAQIYDFQLEVGSTATSYEPYVGGIPSPNPDYPQEVVGVGERTGNLLKLTDDYVTDIRGVSVSIKNGALTIKGTATSSGGRNIYLSETCTLKAGTYTLSGAAVPELRYCLSKVADGSAIIATYGQTTVTLTEDVVVSFGLNFIEGVTYDATVNVMLNEGSTPLPYEPYGYKVDLVSRGKNLFDGEYEVGNINPDTGELLVNSQRYRATNFMPVIPSTTYVVSKSSGTGYFWVIGYKDDFTGVEDGYGSSPASVIRAGGEDNGKTVVAFTTTPTTRYVKWYTTSQSGVPTQLELGTEATEYEPYTPPITTPIYLDKPIHKIGDYTDVLSYSGKSVERPIKELILTGDEDWFEYSLADTYRLSLSGNTGITGYGLSTHFKCVATTSELVNGSFVSGTNSSYFKYENSSLSDFKAYLKEQYNNDTPIKVYYVLATPESKAVEPAEVPTLDGTTIIEAETEIKPSNVYLKYKSSK